MIISDTHIGSQFCRERQLLDLLRTKEYDQLILNGDIIEFLKIPTFTEKAAELLKSIDYNKEVIYVIGNHDKALEGFIGSDFLNIKLGSHKDFNLLSNIFFPIKYMKMSYGAFEKRLHREYCAGKAAWNIFFSEYETPSE